jgi:DNA-binding phage protein
VSTHSFDTDLVLDTDEAIQNFLDAIEAADRRGPMVLPDSSEAIRRGVEAIAKKRNWKI